MTDICVITFSDLRHDARSLNILRTLSKKYLISVISLTSQNDFNKLNLFDISHYEINLPRNQRFAVRWIRFCNAARKILKEKNPRKILACDLYSLFPIYFISTKNKKIYYDSREIYSAMGPLSKSLGKQSIFSFLENIFVHKVDSFIVSGELDAQFLKKHFATKKPFTVIMNLPPYKKPSDKNLIRAKYPEFQNKTILLYQGAVLPGRGIFPAFELLKFNTDLVLVMLGDGLFLDKAKQKAKELGIEQRVAFCGNIDYNELHDWTSSADIGLCNIEPVSFSYELALPNKMFEYIMAGIPQVISDLPAMRIIAEKYEIGEVLPLSSTVEVFSEINNNVNNSKEKYHQKCLEAAKILCYESQEDLIFDLFRD